MHEPTESEDKSAGPGRAFWLAAGRLDSQGAGALQELVSAEDMGKLGHLARHDTLERFRVELYAIASLIADATVRRALDARPDYPPFGLARSMFSEFRVIADRPEPVEQDSIDGFFRLGRTCIDTVVFHLDAEIQQMRNSQRSWMYEREEKLLKLFSRRSSREVQARMRDVFSFMYGGLQFGTSTLVQLLEVMSRMLRQEGQLGAGEQAGVLHRSSRPAHQLAAVNVDRIVAAYKALQPDAPAAATAPAGWMDPAKFVIEQSDGKPWRISLADDGGVLGKHLYKGAFKTQGCPARISPFGGPSPILLLWGWFVDVAEQAGLLGT